MSARHIYEFAPLGSLIRFSNGQPRPPAHHKRKLSVWDEANGVGRLVERCPGRSGTGYSSPATITLHLGNYASQETIILVLRRVYTLGSQLHFEIEQTPAPGAVRVLTRFAGREELHYLASDMAAAQTWMAANRYSGAFAQVVPEHDPVILPSSTGRAA